MNGGRIQSDETSRVSLTIGTIVAIEDDDTLVIRVKPNDVKLQVTRGSVSSLRADKKVGVTK